MHDGIIKAGENLIRKGLGEQFTRAWNSCCSYQSEFFITQVSEFISVQFSSVAQSCLTLCYPMNHSTPGLHHHLLEFTRTHAHRVSDALQSSHPLSSPSPPASNPSQHQSLQRHPGTDLLQNGLVGSPCSPRDSQESSPTPQFKSINSSVLSFLHSPTFTSIHDHWKNHSLD